MYAVTITDQAETDLDRIVHFIEANWPDKIKTDFLATVSEKMQLLETNPFLYRASKTEPSVRECTVNRYVTMYYRVTEARLQIEVLSFKDNRSASTS